MAIQDRDTKLVVQTPEQVEFEHDLAGLGSRFLAFLFDGLIRLVINGVLFTLVLVVLIVGNKYGYFKGVSKLFTEGSNPSIWIFAIIGIIFYVINTGYYIFFETVWNGQSPGKKLLDLRVIREGGYPIGFYEATIRNLLRVVDLIPGNYLVGALFILFSPKEKRLGDYAAGTIVIKEKTDKIPEEKLRDFNTSGEPSILDKVTSNFVKIKRQEYNMIVEFLERKEEMDSAHREYMVGVLTGSLLKKLDFRLPEDMLPEDFLVVFVQAYRKYMKFL